MGRVGSEYPGSLRLWSCVLTSFGRCSQQGASSLSNSPIGSLFNDFSLNSKASPCGRVASVPDPLVYCFSSADSGDGLQL